MTMADYFDQERHQGLSVSTQDPAGRVAKALGIGKRTVKAILSTYHQGGQIAAPALESRKSQERRTPRTRSNSNKSAKSYETGYKTTPSITPKEVEINGPK